MKSSVTAILISGVMSGVMLLGCSAKAAAADFSKIYVFGDSLSDTGNFFNTTGYPPAPYVNGRASNGPIWIDDLTQDLGLNLVPYTAIAAGTSPNQGVNFAFSGATTGRDNINSGNLPGLQQQIGYFTSLIPAGQTADPNALYIIWAGANDYLHGANDPSGPLANLTKVVTALTKLGAHTILVVNLPDLGSLPATHNASTSDALNRLTALHNTQLAEAIRNLDHHLNSEFNLSVLDVNTLFQRALAGELGLTNVSDACLNRSTRAVCANPNGYLFWDDIHPTTVAHQQIEKIALAQLQRQPELQPAITVPTPAIGLGILLVGLLGIGSLVKRKFYRERE